MLTRRKALQLAALVAALPFVFTTVSAQTYPTRTITLVVPFAPGAATDTAARIVGEHMSRTLGQQIVVENVVGAGGTTGSTRVMRAASDGYTILMGHLGTHAFSVALYPNLAYKPDGDFAPIGMVFEQPAFIAARKDFPARDLKEFVAYTKANAEKLNVSHAGVGSINYAFAMLLNSVLGVKPTMVPFTGGAPALNALVAGQVDYMMNGVSDIGQQILSGQVKGYAITSPARHAEFRDIPTTIEAGLPEFQVQAWWGLYAPKAVPQPILNRLTAALDKAFDDAGVQKRFADLGSSVPPKAKRGQQQLAALTKSEIARWTPILKAAAEKTP
jgi:tripartite-type tricarboxylate transporter receptor subunit TctC